jgi:hypothetical protein
LIKTKQSKFKATYSQTNKFLNGPHSVSTSKDAILFANSSKISEEETTHEKETNQVKQREVTSQKYRSEKSTYSNSHAFEKIQHTMREKHFW